MLVLRCTRRILKGSGADVVADPPKPDVPLGEWYVNAVPLAFRGRSAVMYTSSSTLLTVVTFGRALRTTLPVFRERLPRLLRRLELPEDWVERHRAAAEEVCIARTADRRVLGSAVDLAKMLWFASEDAISFEHLDLDDLEDDLGEVPMSMFGYQHPSRLAAALARTNR